MSPQEAKIVFNKSSQSHRPRKALQLEKYNYMTKKSEIRGKHLVEEVASKIGKVFSQITIKTDTHCTHRLFLAQGDKE